MIGVRADGRKELVALTDGYRESTESWADLLRDCARRGMRAPVLAIGDGALGFWGALREVFPPRREQRCWFHKIANVLGCAAQVRASRGEEGAGRDLERRGPPPRPRRREQRSRPPTGRSSPRPSRRSPTTSRSCWRSTTTPPSTGSTCARRMKSSSPPFRAVGLAPAPIDGAAAGVNGAPAGSERRLTAVRTGVAFGGGGRGDRREERVWGCSLARVREGLEVAQWWGRHDVSWFCVRGSGGGGWAEAATWSVGHSAVCENRWRPARQAARRACGRRGRRAGGQLELAALVRDQPRSGEGVVLIFGDQVPGQHRHLPGGCHDRGREAPASLIRE